MLGKCRHWPLRSHRFEQGMDRWGLDIAILKWPCSDGGCFLRSFVAGSSLLVQPRVQRGCNAAARMQHPFARLSEISHQTKRDRSR